MLILQATSFRNEAIAADETPSKTGVPDKLIVLTFDDSAVSHATIVAPLLKKHGFGATFFITEGFDFATNKKHYMTWEQIKKLHEAGFEIGNHTRHHKGVNGQTPKQIDADVAYIEQQCVRHGITKPTSFCYPGYATSNEAVKVLTARGYRFARAGGAKAFDPKVDNPFLMPQAFDGKPGSTFEQFVAAVAAAKDGKVAVMTFHGIPDTPHPWVSTTPEKFAKYMKHLADQKCTVIAMRDLAKYTSIAVDAGKWRHSGSLVLLTTPDGANLPATASIKNFPVLVRLHKDYFNFSQAQAEGQDIRFFNGNGLPLPHEIEEWDPKDGVASVWLKVPLIKGNDRQVITMRWGNAKASSGSNGKSVFNESNGYLSVWHMNNLVQDEVGTLPSVDKGTTSSAGMIGKSRHFPGGKGIFCGDKIVGYPSGASPHSTEAWFRTTRPNTTIIGWGNEGGGRGSKIRMQLRSPPHIKIDSDFSDVKSDNRLPMGEWIHVMHTYGNGPRRIYINGQLDGEATTKLDIKSPSRLWLGGWYHNYDFVGDLDEVRISNVSRPEEWVKLQYENQKPLQTLVGPIVRDGNSLAVSSESLSVSEGGNATVTAKADGAEKLYWILKRNGKETIVAVDRYSYRFNAGRVNGDTSLQLHLKGVYPDGVRTKDVALSIKETIPDPVFTLDAPPRWDGRKTIEIVPRFTNLEAMRTADASKLNYKWSASGMAIIKEVIDGDLILERAQNSGQLTIKATISNGGSEVSSTIEIMVTEPTQDEWVYRKPTKDEKPQDNQFYAREDNNEGTLHYNGSLEKPADSVFLKVYADDKLFKTASQHLKANNAFAFSVKLKPGLIKYKVVFGSISGNTETVLHTAENIVCGDAYIIDGQSNALATDTHQKSPAETSEWIRSYAHPRFYLKGESQNLWCLPVWKAQQGEKAELGWWGMELAKRLVKSQKVPIFIINGAVGGTRIDQHQRSESDPVDLNTIYGRLLWRVREAGLTHSIRAVLWHQGENDQGAAGPDGGYGWETYQQYFVNMSAAWKQDFPNVQRYYIFQIWPNSCSMGGGNGDMLREVQRSLPRLYSNMDIMSTLGIKPGGSCHYPLDGWAEFARLIQPLIERDFYGKNVAAPITPPNLIQAYYTSDKHDEVALAFDQPVIWTKELIDQFYLDGIKDQFASATATGNVITLKLKAASRATKITYLKEMSWTQEKLLLGMNGIAALTFCDVPISQNQPN